MKLNPIDIACPYCNAEPGNLCKTPRGSLLKIRRGDDDTNFHASRRAQAAKPMGEAEREFRRSFEDQPPHKAGVEVYRTKTGKVLTDADIEALAAEAERGYDVTPWGGGEDNGYDVRPARARLPKKLRYKVRDRSHVWCDHHGAVHPANYDYFDEGTRDCRSENWRRVYIESDDKKETF